jgi:hypothetical protein
MFQRVKLVFGIDNQEQAGATPFSIVSAATTNQTLVKSSPGLISSLHVINLNAAVRYIKFYDMQKSPTAGAGTPVARLAIPAATTGAGFAFTLPAPLIFLNGIAFTLVTGAADTDSSAVAANEIIVTLGVI